MKTNTIGILILATNSYFPLGLRLVNRFNHFYSGTARIVYYFVSNQDPKEYMPDGVLYKYIRDDHKNWLEGTNSKFKNILFLHDESVDFIFYMDADTSPDKKFEEGWMLGDSVAAEHFGNDSWMKEKKNYDRNPRSKAYVPFDTNIPQTYYQGAFFGGKKNTMMNVCSVLRDWQSEDKKISYEPVWNDESYINAYFHYNHPTLTILHKDFQFGVSNGGGIDEKRDPNLNLKHLLDGAKKYKNELWNIVNNQVVQGK